MMCETYIGRLKSEDFDYDVQAKEPNTTYIPARVCACKESRKGNYCECEENGRELYWDIVGAVNKKLPNTKQTDWGCFVWRMSKAEMIERLKLDKYNTTCNSVEKLLAVAKSLPDTEDYLLVALEIY